MASNPKRIKKTSKISFQRTETRICVIARRIIKHRRKKHARYRVQRQAIIMEFFTGDDDLISQICVALTGCGCCSRCTLRYLGLKDMYTYRGDTQEMNRLVKRLIDIKLETDKTDVTDDTNDEIVKNKTENGSISPGKLTSENSEMVEKNQSDSLHCDKHDNVEVVKTTENVNDNTEVVKTAENVNDNTEVVKTAENVSDNTEVVKTTENVNDNTEVVKTAENVSDTTEVVKTAENVNDNTEVVKSVEHVNEDIIENVKTDQTKLSELGGSKESRKEISNGMDSLEVQSSCVVCFGVLEEYTSEAFLNKIHSEVTDQSFVFTTYFCSLMLPVCVILREYALMLFLKEKFESVYGDKKYTDVATVKDVWKWKNGPMLKQILGAPFDAKSPFEITLTFNYKNSDRECSFLLDSDLDIFRQRKMDRRHRKKANFAVYTRSNVAAALEKLSQENFKKNYACPPAKPSCTTVCDMKCQNEAVFVAGRYNKYSRDLSQTPWIIEGKRRSESSVEERLCLEINKNFKPKEVKFSSSGREDVDVLMLGNGRPFVLELVNPCRRDFSQKELNEMQKLTNSSTTDIACSDLQIVSREDVDQLKEGEIDKVKQYRALCWTKQPVVEEKLNSLNGMTDLTILQKTPIRVLHRRPLSTRDRVIHSMSIRRVDQHHFSADLATQAGTYIKEFVHGDFGRTKPNMSTLLDVDCDILELDVTAVELDWPKKIQDEGT